MILWMNKWAKHKFHKSFYFVKETICCMVVNNILATCIIYIAGVNTYRRMLKRLEDDEESRRRAKRSQKQRVWHYFILT